MMTETNLNLMIIPIMIIVLPSGGEAAPSAGELEAAPWLLHDWKGKFKLVLLLDSA
jgi:hypothetical protein